jgi:transcription antitermination protein NusB
VSGPGPRRSDTRDPRRARQRALKILFQADLRGEAPDAFLARIADDPRAWAMLDELDPDEAAATDVPLVDPAAAGADPEPHAAARRRSQVAPLDGFTRSLVRGVGQHRDELDGLIQRYARRWTVSRMPVVDRNVLRLGAYELQHEVTSPAVVINEVIELAKSLSTEDSGRYVNGVLEAVRKHVAAERGQNGARTPSPSDDEVESAVPSDDEEVEATAAGDVEVERPVEDEDVGSVTVEVPTDDALAEAKLVEVEVPDGEIAVDDLLDETAPEGFDDPALVDDLLDDDGDVEVPLPVESGADERLDDDAGTEPGATTDGGTDAPAEDERETDDEPEVDPAQQQLF